MNCLKVILFLSSMQISLQSEDLESEFLLSVLEEFGMENPRIINISVLTGTKIMKELFLKKQFCILSSHMENMSNSEDMIVFVNNVNEFKDTFHTTLKLISTLIVIVRNQNFDDLFQALKIPINKKVYFIKESTKEVHETYIIINKVIQNKLGTFSALNHNFIWEENIKQDFLERRSNFHGLTLTAMTEMTGNDMKLHKNYTEMAEFFPNNDTYLVTGFTDGIYNDIVTGLQNQLNFTIQFYKRKKVAWGFVYPQEDGTYKATGMVGDLFFGRVDMVVASMVMLHQRALYIDYLVPLSKYTVGLFISKDATKGDIHYDIYFSPFR